MIGMNTEQKAETHLVKITGVPEIEGNDFLPAMPDNTKHTC